MNTKKGFKLLMHWADVDRKLIYLSVLFALLSGIASIVPYFIFYRIIDAVASGGCTVSFAVQQALILLASTAIRIFFGLMSPILSHRGAYNTLFRVRCMVTEHMAKMPLGALNERSTGEIKFLMNESIEKLELFLAHNLPELVLYLTGPIMMFLYLLTVHVVLALVSIIPLILAAVILVIMFGRLVPFMPKLSSSGGDLSASVSEYVGGMRLIKAFGMGSKSFRKYAAAIDEQHRMWGKISKAVGPLYAAYIVFLECGILLLVPLGGYFFVHGSVTAGVLLLFAFVGTQYLTDVRPLQELSSSLSYVLSAVNQVKEILDTPVFGGGVSFPDKHDIELTNVDFSYRNAPRTSQHEKRDGKASADESGSDESLVLKHCNLHIAHGEKIAVVGESGAGKSTLVQLISRFYDVTEGSIKIGGTDVRDIDYEALLQQISVVFQKSFLTRGTVFENIAMGRPSTTLEEVREAARKAQIDAFIMSLPLGYDTPVGGYGTRFSGGEKQRICIARAILKNSPILILDEATSAADPENQVEIDRAVEHLCRGKTVLIVAHRLGIVQSCDRIVVMERGNITGIGKFEELIEHNAYFSKAWKDYTDARNIRYRMCDEDKNIFRGEGVSEAQGKYNVRGEGESGERRFLDAEDKVNDEGRANA
ncbi:MAG: ABC transporter ATP-binding protein [Bacillota bacterium]|nr:ABC transporter ATP-binding protein [Bacillota bacterium]